LKQATKTPAADYLRYSALFAGIAIVLYLVDLVFHLVTQGQLGSGPLYYASVALIFPIAAAQIAHLWAQRYDKATFPSMAKNQLAHWLYLPYETEIRFEDHKAKVDFVRSMNKRGSYRIYSALQGYYPDTYVVRFGRKADASWARLRYHNPQSFS
jgi:hypothetical protein